MNPSPSLLYFWIPSTKTLSPILKGCELKPVTPLLVGVVIWHVNIPLFADTTCWILIPLVLFVANNSTPASGSPNGFASILIFWIDVPVSETSNEPEFITSLLVELTIVIDGALVYPPPALTISTLEIVLEFLTVINGDIEAWGLNVKSGEYMKLSVMLLVWFKFPNSFKFLLRRINFFEILKQNENFNWN